MTGCGKKSFSLPSYRLGSMCGSFESFNIGALMRGGAPSAVSMSLGILGVFPYSVEAVYLSLGRQECGRRIAH